MPAQTLAPAQSPRPKPRRYQFVPCGNSSIVNASIKKISISPSLCDPLFQDLSHTSRYYVSHFARKLCGNLVTHDVPNHNPYRDLILLSKDHALLLHVIIANSAIEISNIFSHQIRSSSTRSNLSLPGPIPYNLASEKDISARIRQDALVAKQKSLKLLRNALANIETVNWEVVLAAIFLSINFELVNSGKDEWKIHVEGAMRLIDFLGLPSRASSSTMGLLHDYAVADCLIYYILGSVLSPRRPGVPAIHSSQNVLSILERAEANSYMSCPAALLQIMLSASLLSEPDTETTCGEEQRITAYNKAQQAQLLIQQAHSFDINTWAASVQGISSHSDLESRIHVVLAHKSAVCLYIHRAVPFAGLLDENGVETHVRTITHNLSFILPGNQLLKGTSWPTFMAGAESKDPEQQAWVVERLCVLWETLPWGYVHTAIEMLQTIWDMGDAHNPPATPVSWLQRFKALGNDWIVV